MIHGGRDRLIDPSASLRLYGKWVELGVPAELHIVAGALHGFVGEPRMTEPMVSECALFLSRFVIDPEGWDADTEAHNLFPKGPEAV